MTRSGSVPQTARNERIRELWRNGLPAADIAAAMDMTEDGVLSFVRRARDRGEDLPRRSPARKPGTPERDRRIMELRDQGRGQKAIAELLSLGKNVVAGVLGRNRSAAGPAPPVRQHHRQAQAMRGAGVGTAVNGIGGFAGNAGMRSGGCRYPHGDPGARDFHFCGQPVEELGKPYCKPHRELCWQKMPARLE